VRKYRVFGVAFAVAAICLPRRSLQDHGAKQVGYRNIHLVTVRGHNTDHTDTVECLLSAIDRDGFAAQSRQQ